MAKLPTLLEEIKLALEEGRGQANGKPGEWLTRANQKMFIPDDPSEEPIAPRGLKKLAKAIQPKKKGDPVKKGSPSQAKLAPFPKEIASDGKDKKPGVLKRIGGALKRAAGAVKRAAGAVVKKLSGRSEMVEDAGDLRAAMTIFESAHRDFENLQRLYYHTLEITGAAADPELVEMMEEAADAIHAATTLLENVE